MSRKAIGTIIGVVVVIILGAGAYAAMHKSNNSYSTGSTAGSTPTYPTSGSSSSTTNSQQISGQKIGSVLVVKTDSSVGSYLATPSGQALYTYGSDTAGTSNCTGSCLANWPAYQDTGATTGLPANVGTIKRTDNGQTQFTYKGLPLYTFVGDSAGQVTGDGVNGFHVAKQ